LSQSAPADCRFLTFEDTINVVSRLSVKIDCVSAVRKKAAVGNEEPISRLSAPRCDHFGAGRIASRTDSPAEANKRTSYLMPKRR
jgi:hypothetical protein